MPVNFNCYLTVVPANPGCFFFLTVNVFLLSAVGGQNKKACTYELLHMWPAHVLEKFMHAASKWGGLVVCDRFITCMNFSVANHD